MIKTIKKFYSKVTGIQQFAEMNNNVIAMQQQVTAVQQQIAEANNNILLMQQQIMEARKDISTLQLGVKGLGEAILALRYHACRRQPEPMVLPAKLKEVLPITEQFDRLEKLVPHTYAVWQSLMDVNKRAYDALPIDSCSVSGHPVATLFRFFIAPFLEGRVLDIGCGAQKIPIYLEDHPVEGIYGVDPMSEPEDHPFNFVKGLAEFLPWVDSQFNLVVAATSLDHVLLVDKAFEEIYRVLSPDGIFVVWEGFVPGSKAYNPYRHDVEKVDKYHLFHFDRDLFMDAINPYFVVFEEFPVDASNTFFALRLKSST